MSYSVKLVEIKIQLKSYKQANEDLFNKLLIKRKVLSIK